MDRRPTTSCGKGIERLNVLDRIYEAAFVPELWPAALTEAAAFGGAWSGAMLIVDRRLPPLYSATDNIIDTLSAFAQTHHWYENTRLQRMRRKNYTGFLEVGQFSTQEERLHEFSERNLEAMGVGWQIGSVVELPAGETVLFSFERLVGEPNYSELDVARFDSLRPHLARAGLIGARLKLERAQASVDAMNAVGVPAAIVMASGVVVSTNALFETLGDVLRAAAFGRMVAGDRDVDRLLQAALPGPGRELPPHIRSFPVRRKEGRRAIVVHVIPLLRSASDIFERGSAMVAVTGYALDGNVPSDAVLRGLFDLSAAEAGVAAELAKGSTVQEVAQQRGTSVATARTHLAQIFRKTGTRQQSELVALLKGSHTFTPPEQPGEPGP